ncbi:class I mannose-6-phosphate isomerase [Sphingobium algorifonticola]|uniref:Phosphoheptose isomerase n=1 Tax=Sphingobium algorifonticola TaxID=2008318 RepID=A0A437J689_9SPHN|nr:class I mannose-6-phosphate isomerase [Sphingobium algorifonticola]RVT40293.1 phosphoheptose isomerase [Sphingobium algorifonticola]
MPATPLTTTYVAKPWGRTDLPEGFGPVAGRDRIGELWFDAPQGRALPLLVKYIFTSEKLSIQVHPDDAQARAKGLPGGKSECWYILDAQPGATLGIGTVRPLDDTALRAAALDGSIEGLIDWKPVKPGDFFYIPAGTVHAIGAGVTLVEVQQNNDITYRLYDYGRPRALHLDEGVRVSRAEPYPLPNRNVAPGQALRLLTEGDAPFTLDMIAWDAGSAVTLPPTMLWFIPLSGAGLVDGKPWQGGECWLLEDNPTITIAKPTTGFMAWQANI